MLKAYIEPLLSIRRSAIVVPEPVSTVNDVAEVMFTNIEREITSQETVAKKCLTNLTAATSSETAKKVSYPSVSFLSEEHTTHAATTEEHARRSTRKRKATARV